MVNEVYEGDYSFNTTDGKQYSVHYKYDKDGFKPNLYEGNSQSIRKMNVLFTCLIVSQVQL